MSGSLPNRTIGYIPCLNGLRAFAILLVICSHLEKSNVPEWLHEITGLTNYGTVGVRLFFVLSGFLITHILRNEIAITGAINFRKFFIRRILRIFPSFYFFLIVLAILRWAGLIRIELDVILFSFLYIQNFNVFQNTEIFPSSWLVVHSWSLSVEEQFYLIYPFVVHWIKQNVIKSGVWIGLTVLLAGSFFRMLNYSFPEVSRMIGGPFFMHGDFLLAGCILSILFRKNESSFLWLYPYRYMLLFLALSFALIAASVEYQSVWHILISGNIILISNVFILLFFLLYPHSILGRIFELRLMKFIGTISYSLYVWQQLFLGSSSNWISGNFVTEFPNNIVLIFLCAYLSYRFIEKPFLRLKKYYTS